MNTEFPQTFERENLLARSGRREAGNLIWLFSLVFSRKNRFTFAREAFLFALARLDMG